MTCTFKWPLLLYTVVLISFVACSNDDDGSNDLNNIADKIVPYLILNISQIVGFTLIVEHDVNNQCYR